MKPVLERTLKEIQTADGTNLNIVQTTKMMFSFGPVNVFFHVFVGGVKCNSPGQDLMTKFEYQWNYYQHHKLS